MKAKLFMLFFTLICVVLIPSCTQNNENTEKKETVTPTSVHTAALVAEDGTCPWRIIRSGKNEEANGAMMDLGAAIEQETGIKLKYGGDKVKEGESEYKYEIIVGPTNRKESVEAAMEITKSRDFLIARKGTKVVIHATQAINEAVAYFIENYIYDGNIFIADGEKYIFRDEYELSEMTVAGNSISEYSIGYTDSNAANKEACEGLSQWINEKTGYKLPVKETELDGGEKTIIFLKKDEIDFAASFGIRLSGDDLLVEFGKMISVNRACEALLEELNMKIKDGKLSVDTIDMVKEAEERIKIATDEYLAQLDKKAEEMKQKVLNSPSEYETDAGRRFFYFSADGDDNNSGTSEEKPKKSLEALAELELEAGDIVLFRRGDMFRGKITAVSGVTYTAYGEGAKPIINASVKNYANTSIWEKTEYENIWKLSEPIVNVGIMVFDRTWQIGNYKELTGQKQVKGLYGFDHISMMDEDLDFYSDLDTNELFLYCSRGNPGQVYSSIEIGTIGGVIGIGNSNFVTIDNLHITLTGSHGVGASSCAGLTVRNCVFDWLGGSILKGHNGKDLTRFGNAVEIYGAAKEYTVYNNWIYQIYDTGITNQYGKSNIKSNIHDQIEYYDNLIEYCFWSIEYYNMGSEGKERKTMNVSVHDNFCRFGGEGWGCVGRETRAPMHTLHFTGEECENYVVKDNIFDRCKGLMLLYTGEKVEFYENTYIQNYLGNFGHLCGKDHKFDENIIEELAKIGDTSSRLVFVVE
ncbi:MAG: hypothetical protein E7491_03795 [Ruminococcaceae bacterium]|nr:hypothetical protein [Oscillospiraceae bacterium]